MALNALKELAWYMMLSVGSNTCMVLPMSSDRVLVQYAARRGFLMWMLDSWTNAAGVCKRYAKGSQSLALIQYSAASHL